MAQIPEQDLAKLLIELNSDLKVLRKEIKRLSNVEERVRDLELMIAKNSVRLSIIYAVAGSFGGAFVVLLVKLLNFNF